MKADEIGHWVAQENMKFEYSFTTLAFATLALSIQFSPNLGNEDKFLLVSSWIILLLAALGLGYRLMRKQYIYAIDAKVMEYMERSDKEKVKEGRALIRDEDKKLVKFYYFNFIAYLIGVSLNLVFAIINYLHKIPCP